MSILYRELEVKLNQQLCEQVESGMCASIRAGCVLAVFNPLHNARAHVLQRREPE